MADLFGALKRKLNDFGDDVGGAVRTVQRTVAPAVRTVTQQQAPKPVVRTPGPAVQVQRPSFENPVGKLFNAQKSLGDFAVNQVKASPIVKAAKFVDKQVGDSPLVRADKAIGAGVARSAIGTAQGVSGLVDLASKGTGTNRYSKVLDRTAKSIDQSVKQNNLPTVAYKAGQLGGDIATGGAVGRAVGISAKTPQVVNKLTTPLTQGNFGQRVAGQAIRGIANPGLQAGNAGYAALEAGKVSSRGQQVRPLETGINLAAGVIGLPIAGAVAREAAAPVVRAGVNKLRTNNVIAPSRLNPDEVADLNLFNQRRGTYEMDDVTYARGAQAAQKAGIDTNDVDAIQRLLNAQSNYQTQVQRAGGAFTNGMQQLDRVMNPRQLGVGGSTRRIDDGAANVPNPELPAKAKPLAKQLPGEGTLVNVERPLPQVTIPKDAPTSGTAQRGYGETISKNVETPESIKKAVSDMSYGVRNTADLQTRAATLIKENPQLALQVAQNDTTDVGVMLANQLIPKLSREGQSDLAIQLAKETAAKLTKAGQTSQAAAAYGKLAPEGVLRFAQSIVNEYNTRNVARAGKELVLTPQKAEKLLKQSEKLQTMPEGRAKDVATAEMLKEIKEIVPASWVAKISTTQTIAQLLNPKTFIRNIGGNAMFGGGLENVSQVIAAGIDKSITAGRRAAGNKDAMRQVALPSIPTQLRGIKKGATQQFGETMKGVNLGPDTQFDLGDTQTFRKGPMAAIEKTLGLSLRVSDKASYQAAYDDTLRGLMKANKVSTPTQEMLEQANAMGLYRTFQNDSKAAKLFMGLKAGLNKVGFEGKDGKEWGLGDLILKYPKTPGNILSAGIDYSPAGIVKGISIAAINAAKGKPFDQAALSNSIARSTVGTGALVGTGATLGALGIITEKPSQDVDTRNLQKASGQGGYQINTSALRRFVLSGFNKDAAKLKEGDTLVSYDWAQPASIPLSAGAALGKKQDPKDAATSSVASAGEGLNSLVEQPLVTGVSTLAGNIKNKGLVGAVGESVAGAPASFVPTASNQARQLTDNTARSTYDPRILQQSLNKAINRVPGLDRILKPQIDSLGNEKKNYQNDSNNLFNVAFNPAFVNKYQPNQNAKLPLDILKNTGETKQIPQTPKFTQEVNGKNMKLTADQYSQYTKYVGTNANELLRELSKDKDFLELSQNDQANKISNSLSEINEAARIKILNNNPEKTSKGALKVLDGETSYSTNPSGDGSSRVDVSKKLNEDNKTVLKRYNKMNSDERDETARKENDFDYKVAVAKYENDKANGKLSTKEQITAQNKLKKAAVGKEFSKEVRELSELDKGDLYDYVSTQETGKDKKKLVDEIIAYGDKLAEAGVISQSKFRDKYGNLNFSESDSTKKYGKGGKKGGSKKQSVPGISATNYSGTASLGRNATAKIAQKKYASRNAGGVRTRSTKATIAKVGNKKKQGARA